jgi:hypothetical protein
MGWEHGTVCRESNIAEPYTGSGRMATAQRDGH